MKKWLTGVLACVMVLSVTACGSKDFDASGYVQGVLDAQYHGEYAAHAEDVGESEEEIKKQIEEDNFQTAKTAIAASGLTATDDEIQEYVDLIEEGYRKIEYEVQEAVKDDNDNYTVDVVVTPVAFLDNLESIFTEKLTEAANNGAEESQYMSIFNESVKESIDQAETLEPETVTLNVTYTEDDDGNHIYAVNESDLNTLDMTATNQQ